MDKTQPLPNAHIPKAPVSHALCHIPTKSMESLMTMTMNAQMSNKLIYNTAHNVMEEERKHEEKCEKSEPIPFGYSTEIDKARLEQIMPQIAAAYVPAFGAEKTTELLIKMWPNGESVLTSVHGIVSSINDQSSTIGDIGAMSTMSSFDLSITS